LDLGGVNWTRSLSPLGERWLLILGLAVFLMVGVGTMSGERHLLEYPRSNAKWLILLVEAVTTVSIAAVLMALFCCGTLHDSRQPCDIHESVDSSDVSVTNRYIGRSVPASNASTEPRREGDDQ
jgi:hypothetical protein